jgi:hypothetical protein
VRARAGWWVAGLCAVSLIAYFVEPHIYRERFLPVLEENSAPLVDAVRAYQVDTGYAPPNLNALVPRYLDHLPETGYRPVSTFSYSRGPGREWTLEVPTNALQFDVDAFQYYSRVPGWRLIPANQVR